MGDRRGRGQSPPQVLSVSAESGEVPGKKSRGADPDGLAAAIMLAFLATAGFFYVNIMAAIVSGMIDALHFSAPVAGRVGSFNVYGAAVGAFAAVWIVGRLPWRRAAVGLLCALIVCDVVSAFVRDPTSMLYVRTLHGIFGGMLVGISFSVIARTRAPDRTFGMLLAVQALLGGLGLMFLPRLVPEFGAAVLFLSLAAFSLVTLAMLPFLPAYPPRSASAGVAADAAMGSNRRSSTAGARRRWALPTALAAVCFFQAGNMPVAAYIFELGKRYALGLDFMTTVLGIAGWASAAGALIVYLSGDRFGRTMPVAVGMAIASLGTAAFKASAIPAVYAAANVVTAIAWMFVIPYLLGLCATFDRSGRTATIAGLFSKLGLATGPLVASLLVGRGSYAGLVDFAVTALLVSATGALAVAREIDRSSR